MKTRLVVTLSVVAAIFGTTATADMIRPGASAPKPTAAMQAKDLIVPDMYYTPADQPGGYLGLRYKLVLKKERQNECELQEVTPKYQFESGDKIRLRMEANRDAYVYIYNVGTSGQNNLVYPSCSGSGKPGEARLSAYTEASVPAKGWITFDDKTGQEKMYVIVSPKKLEALEAVLAIACGDSGQARSIGGAPEVSKLVADGETAKDLQFEDAAPASAGVIPNSTTYVVAQRQEPRPLVHLITLKHR